MSTSTFVKSFIKNDLMDLASGKKKHHASSSTPGQYSYPLPDQAWQQQQQQQPPYQAAPPNSYPLPPAQAWQQHPPPPSQQPAYYGAQQTYGQPSHAGFAPQAPPPPPYVANPYGQQPPPPPPPPQQQHQYQQQAPPSSYAPPPPPQVQTPGTLTLRPCPSKASLLLVTSGEGQPPVYSVQVQRSGKPKLSLFQGMPSSYGPIATADFSASGNTSTCQVTHRGRPVPCKQSTMSGSFRFEPPQYKKLKWEPDDWTSKKLNCRKSSDSKVAKAKGGSEMEIQEHMDPATVEVMILTMLMARQRQVKDNKIMKDYWEEEGEGALEGGDEGGDAEAGAEVIAEILQALLGG